MPRIGIGIGVGCRRRRGGFSPAVIAGLSIALIGDDAPSGNVQTWTGSLGTSINATQANSDFRPLKVAAVLNGHAVLRFVDDGTGGGDNFNLGDLSGTFTAAASLFIIATLNAEPEYVIYETRANDGWWRHDPSNAGFMGAFLGTRLNGVPAAPPTTGTHLFTITSSASGWVMRRNGVQVGTGAADFNGGNNHRIGLGDGGGQRFNGDIGEILAYNVALSAGNITLVETYLAAKYGVTLP